MDGTGAFPGTRAALTGAETLSRILEASAAARPDAVALRCEGQALTWGEFLARSRRIAGGLAARGLGPGDRLAVRLPAHSDYLLLCFAAWRLGIGIVSVNPRFRHGEIDHVLASQKPTAFAFASEGEGDDIAALLAEVSPEVLSDLRLLILQSDDARHPFRAPPGLASVDCVPLAALEAAPEFARDLGRPDMPAITFTTTGTTGRPKVAVHHQGAFFRHSLAAGRAFTMDQPGALLLEIMPLCGTLGMAQSMGAIAVGCPQILVPHFEGARAAALLREHGATHLITTQDMMHPLLRAVEGPLPFPSLRLVICGVFGPNPPGVIEEATARGVPLHGCYGSSELHALILSQRAGDPPHLRARPGGFPITPDSAIRIRDTVTGELAPPGQPGLLEILAPNAMAGFAGDADATRAVFTEDGWFRTSDEGTIEPDGAFFLIGRAGEALRLGGILTHPAEIEAYLERHPAVAGAQVVGAQGPGGLCTVAFVLPADGAVIEEAALRSWCGRGLAWFKVPDRVVAVERFPAILSGNGSKIQRNVLRDMAQRLLDESAAAGARRTAAAAAADIAAMEARIAAIWAEELEVLHVDPGTAFPDLGGDSLAAVRILHAVETAFDRSLPASAAGALTTVRDMVRLVLASEPAGGEGQAAAPPTGLTLSERRLLGSVMAMGSIPVAHPGATMKLVNPGGTRTPIFWVFNNPAQELAELGAAIRPDQPLYGLYSGGLLFPLTQDVLNRVTRHYADEILALDPTSPCIIGGNCRGGQVAVRLSRLLVEAGKPVEKLCLVEHSEPSVAEWDRPLMMVFGRQSRLRAYRGIDWLRPGWDSRFRTRPVTGWEEGAHGQLFAPRHAARLARRIESFLDGETPPPDPTEARTMRIHRIPGLFQAYCLAERVKRALGEGHSHRINPFTGERRRYTPSVLYWVAMRRLRRLRAAR